MVRWELEELYICDDCGKLLQAFACAITTNSAIEAKMQAFEEALGYV